MSDPTGRSGTRPSVKNIQVKVSVDPQIASAFKEACAASNISMAAELSQFMAGYSNGLVKMKAAPDYSTRRRRRTATKVIIRELEHMKTCEEKNLEITPVNLVGSVAYEVTEEVIATLDEAIDVMRTIYMVP